jgi:hypothetical protein
MQRSLVYVVGWETILHKASTTYIKIPQCMYLRKDIDNGYELLLFKSDD